MASPKRRNRERPTASVRARRKKRCEPEESADIAAQDEVVDVEAPTKEGVDIEDEEATNVAAQDDSIPVNGPPIANNQSEAFPGGPEDQSLLTSFRTHIAAQIWSQPQARGILKCSSHALTIQAWEWMKSNPPNAKFRALIEETGLSPLIHCTYRWTNRVAVAAFIERWQPETNTFHLPFGEMTITLDDVAAILGIPVAGRAVSCIKMKRQKVVDLLVSTLGVTACNSGRRYLFVLYVQSIINTCGNARNSSTLQGCAQNKSSTVSVFSQLLCHSMY